MQTAQKLARRFGLKVVESKQIKSGVYQVNDNDGNVYCIKKMSYPYQEIKWIDSVLSAIGKNGFSQICWCDPNDKQQQLLRQRNNIHVLTPWVAGRTPTADSIEDMRACAQALAAFHHASRGIKHKTRTRNWLGQWPKLFRDYQTVIEGYVQMARKQQLPAGLTRLLKLHGSRILLEARSARKLLKNSRYQTYCHDAAKTHTYCHADSGPKNFVLSREGPVLIDFETLRIDLRIYDIYRMIRLANKSNSWDFSIAKTILDSYREVEELDPGEYELLHVWLLFPHKTYRILRKYADQSTQVKRELEKKLRKEIEARQAIPAFLRSLEEYAKQE